MAYKRVVGTVVDPSPIRNEYEWPLRLPPRSGHLP